MNISGLDTKNVRNKYKESLKKFNGKDINNDIFIEEYNKANYRSVDVIALSTSRFFNNYRHTANLLLAYNYVKKNGDVMNKNLLLMTPFDHACDCRNIKAGTIFAQYKYSATDKIAEEEEKELNLYKNIRPNYKNHNVRDFQLRNVIRNRYDEFTPGRNRLFINVEKQKNLFIYLTGHGGSNYLKIQEYNILSSAEFSLYIQELLIKNYYKFIFVVIDTCHGYSFYDDLLRFVKKNKIENVFLVASSNRVQNSMSLFSNDFLSVSTVDRFTYNFFDYLKNIYKVHGSKDVHKNVKHFSMSYMLNYLSTQRIMSSPTVNNYKFNLTMFLHDKNLIFYSSSPLLIGKDIYDFEYTYTEIRKQSERLEYRSICLSNLSDCDHLKQNVLKSATSFYENRSYYYKGENYAKPASHFMDSFITSPFSNDDIFNLCMLFVSTGVSLLLAFLLFKVFHF